MDACFVCHSAVLCWLMEFAVNFLTRRKPISIAWTQLLMSAILVAECGDINVGTGTPYMLHKLLKYLTRSHSWIWYTFISSLLGHRTGPKLPPTTYWLFDAAGSQRARTCATVLYMQYSSAKALIMASHGSSTQELTNLGPTDWQFDGEEQQTHQSLPPADRGKAAYLFLAACFMLEALVWGFPFAFGVFNTHYAHLEPFASQGGIANIGTTQSGLMYFAAPFVAVAMQRWPKYRQYAAGAGLVLMVAGLNAAAFCNSVSALIATQGVMYALGGLVLYFPAMQLIGEWFIQRRGLAFGLVWAGTGVSGIVVPFLLQWLLDSYGFRTTLHIWSVVLGVGAAPCVYFVRPRLPIGGASSFRPIEIGFMKKTQFWIFELGNVFQSLGFFLPTLYIPAFALSLGLPDFSGPLALALFNLAFCFGAILIGFLVDRFHVTVAIMVSTIGQMIAVFVFWGLSTSQVMLYFFAILFGCFGGGYSATWSGCANSLQRLEDTGHVDAGLMVAVMACGKGVRD